MSGHRSRHVRPTAPRTRKKRPNRRAWLLAALQAKIAGISAQLERMRRINAEDEGRVHEKAPGLATGGFAWSGEDED